jgi:hypothetical protein
MRHGLRIYFVCGIMELAGIVCFEGLDKIFDNGRKAVPSTPLGMTELG